MPPVLSPLVVMGACGPLAFEVRADDEMLAEQARNYFALYSCRWPAHSRCVTVRLERAAPNLRAAGTFLSCAHMSVDRSGETYLADTQYGFTARGVSGKGLDQWHVTVPADTVFNEPETGDMEDLFALMCTVGWRADGWLALHAGAVVKNDTCAIICAPSGGGKSTLTTALLRSGWRTLGDDKMLMRTDAGKTELRALLQTFNLDPATSRWFDLGDLQSLARYSAFTEKRRVPLDWISPGTALSIAAPTHVLRVSRNSGVRGIRASALGARDVLPVLLKQMVLPADATVSKWILRETATAAARLRGVSLEIGDDAYAHDGWLRAIEDAVL